MGVGDRLANRLEPAEQLAECAVAEVVGGGRGRGGCP